MIPKTNEEFLNSFERLTIPSKTYRLNLKTGEISGYCDSLEAVKQAVYKALNTERYDWLIYSWNYGAELKELFGKPLTYVYTEVSRRIEEALLQDDRISEVNGFAFEKVSRNTLHITFKVTSSEGDFESGVTINV